MTRSANPLAGAEDARIGEGLRLRLGQLVAQNSQAAVARAGGATESSVHRYLKGRRIPVEFCVRLCQQLHVNLGWLLMGAGSAGAGEGNLLAQQLTGEMEGLVRVLAALETERGSGMDTTGARHFNALNRVLEDWKRAQAAVARRIAPIAERLLTELELATSRYNDVRAQDLAQSLAFLEQFGLPAELQAKLDLQRSSLSHLRRDYHESARIRERLLWKQLLQDADDTAEVMSLGASTLAALHAVAEHARAARIGDALFAAYRHTVPTHETWNRLRATRSFALAETGRLAEALSELGTALAYLPDAFRAQHWGHFQRMQVMAGLLSPAEARLIEPGLQSRSRVLELIRVAVVDPQQATLQGLLADAGKLGIAPSPPDLPGFAACLHEALGGKPGRALKRWDAADRQQQVGTDWRGPYLRRAVMLAAFVSPAEARRRIDALKKEAPDSVPRNITDELAWYLTLQKLDLRGTLAAEREQLQARLQALAGAGYAMIARLLRP